MSLGFLCETADEYADAIEAVLAMPENRRWEMAEAARAVATARFTEERFASLFGQAIEGTPALHRLLHVQQ